MEIHEIKGPTNKNDFIVMYSNYCPVALIAQVRLTHWDMNMEL